MTPERWQQITDLFHLALAREGPARGALLDEACASDPALRGEVDAMLAAHRDAGEFGEGEAFTTLTRAAGLAPGAALGAYRIETLIGTGGMGEVYRARDSRLDRDVAIKVLPAHVSSDPHLRQRFEREARAASALNHPNIVTIHDINEHAGTHYIAMELVEGRTLRDLLAAGPLALDCQLAIGRQLADGLAKAHGAGIVHRDLKPENLMVTRDGLLKILDFGLAKLSKPSAADGSETTTTQATEAGTVLGTAPYMSPEQAAGRPVDFRSDQFSVGSILYEMATGRRAFRKDTLPQTLAAIIEGEPEPADRLNRSLPGALVRIIRRCLAKKPEDRFATTPDLAAALHGVPAKPALLRIGWRLPAALAGLLALGLAASFLPRARDTWRAMDAARSLPAIQAVAVLPLQNLSGDPEQQYFADGMTEALITDLAKIGSLKVISRSSAMRYKGTKTPLGTIARELGVDAIVEGSAQRVGGRVRIMAQLIDPATDRALWGESYDRDFGDVLGLQAQVAQSIARAVGAAVTPEERERLTPRRSVDGAALEAYLRGLYHLQRFTPQDFDAAQEFFEAALKIDPDYASAYAGIAQIWGARMQAGLVPAPEAAPRRLAAVEKALALDGGLSEARLALAQVRTWYEWDWKSGEAEFQRAIELNSSNAQARIFYSHLLTVLGHSAEGTEQARRALELDPLNPLFQTLAGVQLIMAGRLDDGIARIRATHQKMPGFGFGYFPLAIARHEQGRHAEALEAMKEHYTRAQGQTDVVNALDRGFAAGGYRAALRRAAEALEARSRSRHVPSFNTAQLCDKAGDIEKALEWLDRAYEERDPNMPYVGAIPFSAELRAQPRYQDLLRRLVLTDQWRARTAKAGP